ncbi:MAG TPA: NUDIX domain-containing protein, partial [Propionibacteriaceae bacterium]|nr:NUDIX domain-containing protein [Propionibacteriaceae bacterium]
HPIGGAWFQPGGHLEATDVTLADAARREVREETGLEVDLDETIVHLDCHPIACRGSAPTRHFDVRFVGVAAADGLTISHESDDLSWWGLDEAASLSPEMNDFITVARVRLEAFSAAGRRWER